MSALEPEISALSIVLVGAFNPAIYHPAWLGSQELIRKSEAETARVEVVHPDVAVIQFEAFRLEVVQQKLVLVTQLEPYFVVLRDLAIGIFRALSHTPVTALGINRDYHFRMPSEESWHNFGHRLAPKEFWRSVLEAPGLRSMTMQGQRAAGRASSRQANVKVATSTELEPYGIYVQVNDHHSFESLAGQGTSLVLANLEQYWEETLSEADRVFAALARCANECCNDK